MSDIAIRVENLGKQYRIGGKQERYKRFTESAMDVLTAPVRRLRNLGKPAPEDETIWALRDVSFEIKRGEAVGIIGRNGAGKSTLLKILSRITEPTTGRVELQGRVSSLLEVGTGFHPELTGRENIYLNGTILGMRRAEIDAKFDDIVDFSGVSKFLDTPVKRYSSGMQVRLAFSVAAHLEPEILLVDEVLAVGDAEFQKKCLGKMGEVTQGGRTVLFVSHNMAAVRALCSNGAVLDSGELVTSGAIQESIAFYGRMFDRNRESIDSRRDRQGNRALVFRGVSFQTKGLLDSSTAMSGESLRIVAEYRSETGDPLTNVSVSIPFYDQLDQQVFMCWTSLTGQDFKQIPPCGSFIVDIPLFPLRGGRYFINLHCTVNGVLADWVKKAAVLDVIEGDFFGTGRLPAAGHGLVFVEHSFHFDLCEDLSGETEGQGLYASQ